MTIKREGGGEGGGEGGWGRGAGEGGLGGELGNSTPPAPRTPAVNPPTPPAPAVNPHFLSFPCTWYIFRETITLTSSPRWEIDGGEGDVLKCWKGRNVRNVLPNRVVGVPTVGVGFLRQYDK